MIKRKTFRVGWVVAVLMLITLACTCGPLSQITQGVSTAQAVASQAQGLATDLATSGVLETVQALSSEVATSGAVETALAVATDASLGQGPADIPVFADKSNLFATGDLVSYTANGTFDQVAEFYKTEMPNNGWVQSHDLVTTTGTLILGYTKEGRKSTVTIIDGGSSGITVAIAISK